MGRDGKKFIIESNLSYFLHPSKGLGILITVVIVDGKNYDLQEQAITTALLSKNKLGFIDGTLQKPSSTDEGGKAEL